VSSVRKPPAGVQSRTAAIRTPRAKSNVRGARFRIFEYDESGTPSRELTAFDAQIKQVTWTVHLANKKGSWYNFVSRYEWAAEENHPLRNASRDASDDPDTRTALIIDPGPVTISGVNQSQKLPDAHFLDTPVALGELRTDDHGRLVVLGGAGCSAADDPPNLIHHFVNNDGWHDDTADGVVQAHIVLADDTTDDADPAWVIVAPQST